MNGEAELAMAVAVSPRRSPHHHRACLTHLCVGEIVEAVASLLQLLNEGCAEPEGRCADKSLALGRVTDLPAN